MKTLYKSEQSGRSMVEMLGVLAIIGVLSVGGIAGYSKAMAKFKTTKTMDQVAMLVANIRTLYSGQPSYTGLTTGVAIKMGAVGAEMLNGVAQETATTVYNAFNGAVFVKAAAGGRSFVVTFTGLSNEACVALGSADWGSGSGSGLVKVGTSNAVVKAEAEADAITTTHSGTTTTGNLPLPLATAAAGCNGKGDINTVQWEYM